MKDWCDEAASVSRESAGRGGLESGDSDTRRGGLGECMSKGSHPSRPGFSVSDFVVGRAVYEVVLECRSEDQRYTLLKVQTARVAKRNTPCVF